MALDCIQKVLEKLFYRLGKFVARHPLPFVIFPVVLSGVLGVGILRMHSVMDTEELYTPTNGPGKAERRIIRQLFPENETHAFIPDRRTTIDGTIQVILHRTDESNIYTEEGVRLLLQVNTLITGLSVEGEDGRTYGYEDLCGKFRGECSPNLFLLLLNYSASNINLTSVRYPFHTTPFNVTYFSGFLFGGVEFQPGTDIIQSAEATIIIYTLRYMTKEEEKLADTFQRKTIEELQKFEYDSPFSLTYQASISLDDVLAEATEDVTLLFSITYFVISAFSVITCYTVDPVRAKGWLATGAVLSAVFASLSSLGLLSAIGVPFTTTVGSVPFLITGIGIDDIFILIASWRETSYSWPVEERMGRTYEKAAVSITVTSITDFLAFCVGAITTFKAVVYFCLYAGVAVLFSYIYAITFCGGCMAYSGFMEHQNRHSAVCCVTVQPKSRPEYDEACACAKVCCFGGDEVHLENKEPTDRRETVEAVEKARAGYDDNQEVSGETNNTQPVSVESNDKFTNTLMRQLIEAHFCGFLLHPVIKVVVLILYAVYLAFGVFGCYSLEEGLDIQNLAPDDSYLNEFFAIQDRYFRSQNGFKVMVAFTDTLEYHKLTVQADIEKELQKFRDSRYFETENTLTDSWLSTFVGYLQSTNKTTADMATFIRILRTEFLTISHYSYFSVDLQFNNDFSTITASRFILQTKASDGSVVEKNLMLDAREIASMSPFAITVFSAPFVFFDQYVVILMNTLQNIAIAVVSMMFVSVLLLPSLIAVVFVTLSVVSISVGVIGFMVFWNVNLDSISMINLIITIGFSVDFSAHISYHFAISRRDTGNARACETLTHVGFPIIQGAISTILGVSVLAFSNTYIFRTFFKIMFLVMVFGFWHAFFVLPVVLSLTHNCSKSLCKEKVRNQ